MTEPDKQTQFDQWSATYDEDIRDDGLFPFDGYERVLQRVVDLAAVQPGLEILELGVGTGNLTRRLVDLGAAVWAVDFSADMLAIARQKVPQARFAQADLLGEFPKALQRPFDRVIATYIFHEFPLEEKIGLLQRLFANNLTAGGYVVIGDIGFADAAAREIVKSQAQDRWDEEYYWLAEETQSALAQLDFTLNFEPMSSCGVVLTVRRAEEEQRH
jgi:putative AdoMet-dependent methyltransferase